MKYRKGMELFMLYTLILVSKASGRANLTEENPSTGRLKTITMCFYLNKSIIFYQTITKSTFALFQFLDTYFVKVVDKSCGRNWVQPKTYYATLQEAKDACIANPNCSKVQDSDCDNDDFVLCLQGSNGPTTRGTCIYIKETGGKH